MKIKAAIAFACRSLALTQSIAKADDTIDSASNEGLNYPSSAKANLIAALANEAARESWLLCDRVT